MRTHTLRDRIQNKDIRKGLGIFKNEKKMKENRLGGLGMCKDGALANR